MAATTRDRLVEAANRAFAEHGILGASLVEVTRQAGQRNRGAVHYHFGGRDELLAAVLEQHADFLAQREGELLALATTRPHDDVASVVEAVVRPCVELAESGESGRNYVEIVGELIEQDPATRSETVEAMLARTGGYEVYALLEERVPRDGRGAAHRALRADDVVRDRLDRAPGARTGQRRRSARESPMSTERFVANLVIMAAGMLGAPLVPT